MGTTSAIYHDRIGSYPVYHCYCGFDGPGGKVTTQPNMHLTKNVYIGETKADGQFKILKSFDNVYGEPWLKGKFKATGVAANKTE